MLFPDRRRHPGGRGCLELSRCGLGRTASGRARPHRAGAATDQIPPPHAGGPLSAAPLRCPSARWHIRDRCARGFRGRFISDLRLAVARDRYDGTFGRPDSDLATQGDAPTRRRAFCRGTARFLPIFSGTANACGGSIISKRLAPMRSRNASATFGPSKRCAGPMAEPHYISQYDWPTVHHGFLAQGKLNPAAIAYLDRKGAAGPHRVLVREAIGIESPLLFDAIQAVMRAKGLIRRGLAGVKQRVTATAR